MTTTHFPRILVIATWFGPLPSYFSAWLTSCRYNPDIDWLVVTDADPGTIDFPPNVHLRHLSMAKFAARIEVVAGFPIAFEKPYKACDYRPLYSGLINLVDGNWDFWGHCDLDMLFGNIRAFLSPTLLSKNDRIFGVGHFSIYRNNESTNTFYRRLSPGLDFQEILMDPRPRGFDEHIGVNKIWHHNKGRFHEDENVLADIDPNIGHLHRTSNYIRVHNNRRQAFCFDKGRVLRVFWKNGRLHKEEFMYIHFQKRRFKLPPPPLGCDRMWITPAGLVPMGTEENLTPIRISELNPVPLFPSRAEMHHRLRRAIRIMRRRIMRGV